MACSFYCKGRISPETGQYPVKANEACSDWAGLILANRQFLLNVARTLLAIPLACQRFLRPAFFARLQVERVAFDFLDDIFLLNFAFKTAQRAFERFAILQMDFCQLRTHHLSMR